MLELFPTNLSWRKGKSFLQEQIGSVVNNFKNKVEGYLGEMDTYVETIGDRFKQYRTAKRHLGELQDELAAQGELIVEDVDAAQIEANVKKRINSMLTLSTILKQLIII